MIKKLIEERNYESVTIVLDAVEKCRLDEDNVPTCDHASMVDSLIRLMGETTCRLRILVSSRQDDKSQRVFEEAITSIKHAHFTNRISK